MRTGELYQRYYGIYIAEVIDVEDPEKLGRVRVKADQFEDTTDEPVWANVIRPLAGDGTGVFFTPKPGDQVAVGYLVGDVREPMILGYAHSTARRPDTAKVGPRKHGVVTTVGRVVFDEDAKEITITFDGPPTSTLKFDATGITLDVQPQTKVKLDPTGITLNAPTVTIQGTAAINLATAALNFAAANVGFVGGPSPAKLCLDGQGVVLKSFIDLVYKKHKHDPVTDEVIDVNPSAATVSSCP